MTIPEGSIPIAVSITSPFETDMFHLGEKNDREEWLLDETAHGYQVQVAVPRDYVLSGSIFSSIFILALSLLFIVILYVTLKKTFSKYQPKLLI